MSVAAPGLARRAVEALDLEAGERESISLVASELVTNAVRHSGSAVTTTIRITARITGDVLRLSVTDGGTGLAAFLPREQAGTGGGFGLLLVDRLAARWGVERGGATTVWCELVVSDGARANAGGGGNGPPSTASGAPLTTRTPDAHTRRETSRQRRDPPA